MGCTLFWVKFGHAYFCVSLTLESAILHISNCPRVRTSDQPEFNHRTPIFEQSKEKNCSLLDYICPYGLYGQLKTRLCIMMNEMERKQKNGDRKSQFYII